MEAGRFAAGAGRAGATSARLDPFSLPVRFTAADEAADERLRVVDLHRERVVLRRSVRGIRMALNMPVASYRGVAIRLSGETGKTPTSIAVVLEHRDPALSLPLFASAERDDIVAEWQSWGRVLGLPLLGRRRRRIFARTVRPHGRAAHRSSDLAPPPPQRHRQAPAFSLVAPPPRQAAGHADRASRRTRDHRAKLKRASAPAFAEAESGGAPRDGAPPSRPPPIGILMRVSRACMSIHMTIPLSRRAISAFTRVLTRYGARLLSSAPMRAGKIRSRQARNRSGAGKGQGWACLSFVR